MTRWGRRRRRDCYLCYLAQLASWSRSSHCAQYPVCRTHRLTMPVLPAPDLPLPILQCPSGTHLTKHEQDFTIYYGYVLNQRSLVNIFYSEFKCKPTVTGCCVCAYMSKMIFPTWKSVLDGDKTNIGMRGFYRTGRPILTNLFTKISLWEIIFSMYCLVLYVVFCICL